MIFDNSSGSNGPAIFSNTNTAGSGDQATNNPIILLTVREHEIDARLASENTPAGLAPQQLTAKGAEPPTGVIDEFFAEL